MPLVIMSQATTVAVPSWVILWRPNIVPPGVVGRNVPHLLLAQTRIESAVRYGISSVRPSSDSGVGASTHLRAFSANKRRGRAFSAMNGEGGIRTREGGFPPYSLS